MDKRFIDHKENPLINPVDYFNWYGDWKIIFESVKKKVYHINDTQINDDPNDIRKPSFELDGSNVKICGDNNYDLAHPMTVTKFMLLTAVKFKGDYNSAFHFVLLHVMKVNTDYIRVGCDYFRIIKKPNRYGGFNQMLKAWKKEELKQDAGPEIVKLIPKFSDFTIVPNNKEFNPVINDCYNLYAKFPHKPFGQLVSLKDIQATDMLMNHIFGDQVELGYKYMKVLYENPTQILPVLVLVSITRQTGKTTFLNWIDMIFGENSILIYPNDLKSQHNSGYATKNILLIDETLIEKSEAAEKLKSLSTAKNITVDPKFIQQYSLPFFGKIIMATNKELDFMKIDVDEIRYWIRKVPTIPDENHNVKIEDDLFKEIPKFLKYLSTLPPIDFTKSRMVFTKEEILTENLTNAQDESRSWLYKEIEIFVEDYFQNNENKNELLASPLDIKKKWFNHNSKVDINYIRRILKHELKLKYTDKTIKYYPIWIEVVTEVSPTHTGKPFIFTRSNFVKEEFESENLPF